MGKVGCGEFTSALLIDGSDRIHVAHRGKRLIRSQVASAGHTILSEVLRDLRHWMSAQRAIPHSDGCGEPSEGNPTRRSERCAP